MIETVRPVANPILCTIYNGNNSSRLRSRHRNRPIVECEKNNQLLIIGRFLRLIDFLLFNQLLLLPIVDHVCAMVHLI